MSAKLPYLYVGSTDQTVRLMRAFKESGVRYQKTRFISGFGVCDIIDYPDGFTGYWHLNRFKSLLGGYHYEASYIHKMTPRIEACVPTNSIEHFISSCQACAKPQPA